MGKLTGTEHQTGECLGLTPNCYENRDVGTSPGGP